MLLLLLSLFLSLLFLLLPLLLFLLLLRFQFLNLILYFPLYSFIYLFFSCWNYLMLFLSTPNDWYQRSVFILFICFFFSFTKHAFVLLFSFYINLLQVVDNIDVKSYSIFQYIWCNLNAVFFLYFLSPTLYSLHSSFSLIFFNLFLYIYFSGLFLFINISLTTLFHLFTFY